MSARSSMSLQKHRSTGWKNGAGKSPKLRQHLKREAEKQDRKAPPKLPHSTVSQAFSGCAK